MGHCCGTLLWDSLPAPQILRVLKTVVLQGRQFSASSSPHTPRTTVVLQGRQFSASSSADCSAYSSCTTKSPVLSFQLQQIAPRTKVVLPSHQFSSSSSPDTPRTKVVLQSRQCSPAFRALDTHDLRRGLRGHRTNRTLACISRTRHARSPQRVARAWDKSHSRLHFAHSTRTISAEGCAHMGQIALSPAFRALDTHDLRRGLRAHGTNRTLACISRTRHARSPQRVARTWDKSHSRLHFAHSTRTISAEGCASSLQNERFVRDFLKNSHVKVCKTSVSYETSSKSQAETPIGAHTSRSPAKQFRDSSPSKQHPLTRQSQWDSDIHLYHNSQPHDSLRLPRIFPHPHV